MFKVGDVCKLHIKAYPEFGEHEVIIRGTGYHEYEWTVENVNGRNGKVFHRCLSGPVVFGDDVGRWVHSNELTLIRTSQREPTKFAKFIWDETSRVVEVESSSQRRKIDELTRMLCALCTEQQGNGTGNLILHVPGLKDWWAKHQEQDRKREAAERELRERQRKADEQALQTLAKKLGKKVL